MAKIKIDSALYERAKKMWKTQGYSSIDEFFTHIIEKEVARCETDEQQQVTDQLKGLGYID